jgi:DNA-binding HxlR family transcriptional regulator
MAERRKSVKKAVSCPVETTIAIIGGRWKVLVLHFIVDGPKRFGELTNSLKGVSARTLTKQLRELEKDGIIRREVFRQIPPKVEYSLAHLGRKLKPVLTAMHDWGIEVERARSR